MEYQTAWVKLARYTELTGDTADAVHARRRQLIWKDGVHCKLANGKLWINLKNVDQWVEECGTAKGKAV